MASIRWRSSVRSLCLSKKHASSALTSMGILKWECAVRPPGSREKVTPLDATASAAFPWLRTAARIVVYRNVFPVPPEPSTKKKPRPSVSLRSSPSSPQRREVRYIRYSIQSAGPRARKPGKETPSMDTSTGHRLSCVLHAQAVDGVGRRRWCPEDGGFLRRCR